MKMNYEHRNDDAVEKLQSDYERHLAEGILPRWNRTGLITGLVHEYWCNRTLDNLSITPCGLHVIEGIYGRDGDSGIYGPHPLDQEHEYNEYGGTTTGRAQDFMSNIIVFGKDPFRVDIIGHWLAGYEPGNMGLFHIAIERGFSNALDPRKIPVYLWEDGTANLAQLEDFERTPLLGCYLTKDYDGGNESRYHLVNEPFDYGKVSGIESPASPDRPDAFVLHQNHPNPFNPSTAIEYELPVDGYARIEIYNLSGQCVDVLVDRYHRAGSHMAVWRVNGHASGTYICRFRYGDYTKTMKMLLVK
jgi:hypothetical protein